MMIHPTELREVAYGMESQTGGTPDEKGGLQLSYCTTSELVPASPISGQKTRLFRNATRNIFDCSIESILDKGCQV